MRAVARADEGGQGAENRKKLIRANSVQAPQAFDSEALEHRALSGLSIQVGGYGNLQ